MNLAERKNHSCTVTTQTMMHAVAT